VLLVLAAAGALAQHPAAAAAPVPAGQDVVSHLELINKLHPDVDFTKLQAPVTAVTASD
jgi:hypothetical protein